MEMILFAFLVLPVADVIPQQADFVIEYIKVDPKELITGSFADFEVRVRNRSDKAVNITVRFYIDGKAVGEKTIRRLDPEDCSDISFRRTFRYGDKGSHRALVAVAGAGGVTHTRGLVFTVRDPVKVLLIDGDEFYRGAIPVRDLEPGEYEIWIDESVTPLSKRRLNNFFTVE